ncbi:threonine-phosphate decarboxylase CobD [Massilia sp. CF038]|uniref:threonine-phosphate decarboxylase CobD n=1 Tax=Massilia sp. CF038 TaxID=1881045 RepID=UPI00091BD0B3|nr:threonine-phosphate decarboxylase CobD [Massilia sp. CF038]SHH73185.1 L-threonine O-3-phosphate decarboxylase [Massilia sp. CF038]
MLEHGGNLRAAMALYGGARDEWLDLSTGLNPRGYPAPQTAPDAWHRLPEPDPGLLDAAQAYYRAPHMLAVAGTQAAIQALPQMRMPRRVVVAAPSYAEHAHHWQRHGHAVREVAYQDLAGELPSCDIMVVCNPNNPTGETVGRETLLAWALDLAARGGWLIVDEAFGDVTPEASVAEWSNRPGLIVLRSIGKFFGLAGVRVGFVGAHEEVLTLLGSTLGPWTVSGPAQQIAQAALRDSAWQHATQERLMADGARLRQLLAKHGIVSHGCAMFQWWPEAAPEAFREHMAQRQIWVRLFPHAARGIRLGLPPDEAAWQRLKTALTEWKQRTA